MDPSPRFRPTPALAPSPEEIAGWIGGRLIDGASAPPAMTGFGTLDEAGPADVSFLAHAKHLKSALASSAGLIIAPPGSDLPGRARIEVPDVWGAVAVVMNRLFPQPVPPPGVHPTAVIGQGARIGEGASIGPYCVIGDGAEIGDFTALGPHCAIDAGCRIGSHSRLFARVTLQGMVDVGSRVILHPGVVLGADGFRYESGAGGILKIPQVGLVRIEDDVEIGANTTIDRPFLHETRIGRHTKIDNLVQVGHNCNVGCHVIIAGCTALAGSVTIEDGCIIGGKVAMSEGITVGKGSMVGGMSALNKDYPPGSILAGLPARPHREFFKTQAHIQRLPLLIKRVEELEKNSRKTAKG